MIGTQPPHESTETPGTARALTVAIVGSGPAGCYTGQFLAKSLPGAEITVFESLPAPYGLVRYGVAADHQGTKGVARQFDRLFTRDGVRFVGNVTVGRDVEFARIAANFDVVVLATGLPGDRELDVPRDPRAQVVGAGTLLRALNGFPRDRIRPCAPLGPDVVVVGMGNVAVDVLRLLAKDTGDFAGTDIDDEMLRRLRPAPPSTIAALARSGAPRSKCDAAMLRELVSLPGIGITVSGMDERDEGPVVDVLRPFVSTPRGEGGRTRVTFHFGLEPERITSREGRTVLTARDRNAARQEFVADTVVTAIGFTHGGAEDETAPRHDWSGDHVYRVGWFSRGAQGTIARNRKDAQQVARRIADDVAAGRIRPAKDGFRAVAGPLADRMVGFEAWQRIEAAEHRSALPGRCRRKITDLGHMLAVATGLDEHERKELA
ncbi:oxidoreductase [Amycolatopsis acidicola]|uniref:Oxidoreductase n=1 Tax=Amycolatopsis acidicola TaxID=2596893 RepID=A0A5N0VGP2_9PSEU|nr:NAD(P)-binding protein [Amycolatopsis acidicola]KAA9165519.1 oxidoreductase [Amycolatopsis acidicola]